MSEASEGVWKLRVGRLAFRRVEVEDMVILQRRTIRKGDQTRYRASLLPHHIERYGASPIEAILALIEGNKMSVDCIVDPCGAMYDGGGREMPFDPCMRGAVEVTPGQIQQLVAERQQEREAAVAQKRALIERVRQWAKGGRNNLMVINLGDIRQLVAMAEESVEKMEAETKEQGR